MPIHHIECNRLISKLEAERDRERVRRDRAYEDCARLRSQVESLDKVLRVRHKEALGRADERNRLREALAEMYRCFRGLDQSKMYAAALEQARQLIEGPQSELDKQLAETDVDDNHSQDLDEDYSEEDKIIEEEEKRG